MKQMQQISESELMLMRMIWACGGTALYANIMDELERKGVVWKKNTVLTFLSRLVEKKLLSTNKLGRRNEYQALVTEAEYQEEQTKQFVEKVYSGSVQGLVNMLVGSELVNQEDVAALRNFWKENDPDE